MEILRELEPNRRARQIRHTFVRGRDGNHYKVLTYRLYDRDPPPEFHNYEVNVQRVDENGRFRELYVPYFRRAYREADALKIHDEILQSFDDLLGLEEPPQHGKQADKAAAKKTAPAPSKDAGGAPKAQAGQAVEKPAQSSGGPGA